MLDSLKESAEAAVELAKEAGASDVFTTLSRNREVEFRYRDGQLEKAQENTTRSLSISLFVEGRYSSSSTTDLREDRLKDFVEESVALTKALEPDPDRRITDPALFAGRSTKDLELLDSEIDKITPEKRLASLESLYETAKDHSDVISCTTTFYDEYKSGAAASSNGFSGTWEESGIWLGTSVTARDTGDKRQRGGLWAGSHHLNELPDPKTHASRALQETIMRLGAVQGPTGRMTMVVHPRAASRMINYLLRPAKAAAIQQKQSFWDGILGKKAFSDKLTVVDDPLLVRGLNSRYFDYEGIAAKPLTLIENGVATGLYVNTYYGKKLGMQPTTGSSSNGVVSPGEHDLDQLTASMDNAILVTGWLGGNSDRTTGDFSLGCQGHLISKGKIGAPIGEMNVTGNLVSLFANLAEVGNDPWPYASILTPTLVFEDVQFSGS